MKKILLFLPFLLLTGCNNKKYDDSFDHFCDFYDNYHVSCHIESTTDHDVHELKYVSKTLMGKSNIKRDDYNFIYAKLNVTYISDHKVYELNWLVEYKYSDDYSYEQATDYSVAYIE